MSAPGDGDRLEKGIDLSQETKRRVVGVQRQAGEDRENWEKNSV